MANEPLFVYAATYNNLEDAKLDYRDVQQLYRDGVIGVYDAAIIHKDPDGTVQVSQHEKPTEYGAWTGLAVGALTAAFFPAYLIGKLVLGAGVGALIGHLWGGMSRSDLKQIGTMLSNGSAALIVIGKSRLKEALAKAVKHATQQYEAQLSADTKAFNKALTDAVNEMTKSEAA
ncbi:MAG: DUF1269 domain-containing protein [Candidatus Manganitrophus sp.]|nr:MAG: DUF1269 domain-containing protein [Candidatus Manganitrophus sp.]